MLIPQCEFRVDEEVVLVMVMQYPAMSGSTPDISRVNGDVQLMKMLERSADITRESTASRRPK